MEKKILKVFVLEDDITRVEWFSKEFSDCEFTVAATAELGKYYVKNYKYDVIFLDHDLGGQIYVPSHNVNTGYWVAKAIPDSINKNTPVIIHSYNPAGAAAMHQALPKTSVLVPFGTFKRDILKG